MSAEILKFMRFANPLLWAYIAGVTFDRWGVIVACLCFTIATIAQIHLIPVEKT